MRDIRASVYRRRHGAVRPTSKLVAAAAPGAMRMLRGDCTLRREDRIGGGTECRGTNAVPRRTSLFIGRRGRARNKDATGAQRGRGGDVAPPVADQNRSREVDR